MRKMQEKGMVKKADATAVLTKVIVDPELSMEAKGLYAYMVHIGSQEVSEKLGKQFKGGLAEMYSAINELKDHGYIKQYNSKRAPKKSPAKKKRFVAPKVEEVIEYYTEEKSLLGAYAKTLAESFHNYYESINWIVGRKKMVKWKAAASGFLTRDKQWNKTNKGETNDGEILT